VYTQCPQCQTLYRVTAELLRAARGQVQCGRCAAVFDALSFLVEDEAIDGAAAEAQSTTVQQVPLPPGSTAEVHRVDEFTSGSGACSRDDESEPTLEFNLPPDAVDRVFVEAPKMAIPAFASVAVLSEAAEVHFVEADMEPEEDIDIPLTVDEPSNDPVAVEAEPDSVDEPPQVEEQDGWEIDAVPAPPEPEPEEERPTHIVEPDDATVTEVVEAGEPANEDRAPGGLRRRTPAMADDDAPEDAVEFGDTAILRERAVHYGWRIGGVMLGLLLVIQFVHYDRHDLVRRPTFGPFLQRAYAAFGLPLSPEWNLKAYQVRQWGAAAPPGAQGTLRVRASVVNSAEHAQPVPLLRLTLADLAGARVGVRDFEPHEYLPAAATNEAMLGAGRRIDAEVVIVDPGKDAVGFEIDVCLRDDEHRVHCANDPVPAG